MKRIFFLFVAFVVATTASAQYIATIAGTDTAGFSGDDGPATAAKIFEPVGIAIDNSGNIYFADCYNYRVRKINTSGTITTIAGTGIPGYNGDNIAATSAQLNAPCGVAVDAAGNVYISDQNNFRVRRVTPAGTITTIAGTGVFGTTGDSVAATAAQLTQIYGIAIDTAGNLYIGDQGSNRIRKINTAGIITTVAGNGTMGYSGDHGPATAAMLKNPCGVAVDRNGNIYLSDVDNHCIRKVDNAGIITTIAGTGIAGYNGDNIPATNAKLYQPYGVAVDDTGNVFIVDDFNSRVRKVAPSGIITTVIGDGTMGLGGDSIIASAAICNNPNSIAITKSGDILLSDGANNRIRKTYKNALGIVDQKIRLGIDVYPNPSTNGRFAVDLSSPSKEKVIVRIYDLAHRQVYSSVTFTNQQMHVDLNEPMGVYILHVISNSGIFEKEIILMK